MRGLIEVLSRSIGGRSRSAIDTLVSGIVKLIANFASVAERGSGSGFIGAIEVFIVDTFGTALFARSAGLLNLIFIPNVLKLADSEGILDLLINVEECLSVKSTRAGFKAVSEVLAFNKLVAWFAFKGTLWFGALSRAFRTV